MRNMFGGSPPDDWGSVCLGLSGLAGLSGIAYFTQYRKRHEETTQSHTQEFLLILLVLANLLPPGQIAVGLVSYFFSGY